MKEIDWEERQFQIVLSLLNRTEMKTSGLTEYPRIEDIIEKSESIVKILRKRLTTSSSETLFPKIEGDKMGYINETGIWVISPSFDEASPFSDGMARVKLRDKYGYINSIGGLIIMPLYKWLDFFYEDLAVACLSGSRLGYIDKKGNWMIEPIFEHANEFSDGLAAVEIDNKTGYINHKGEFEIEPQFYLGDSFNKGVAFAKEELGGLWGLIDKKGNWIHTPSFKTYSSFDKDGYALVIYSDEEVNPCWMNRDGRVWVGKKPKE